MPDDKKPNVFGGRFYVRRSPFDPLEEMHGEPGRAPDAWICRRVADFPGGHAPAGAAIGACHACGAPIAYNPGRVASVPLSTPQRCMQCSGITPLPIES